VELYSLYVDKAGLHVSN